VNGGGPDVHGNEQSEVEQLVHGENERIDVVRRRLRETINWVERVRSERRAHEPTVVGLVNGTVQDRVVQPAVNPVDAEIRKEKEEWDGDENPRPTPWVIFDLVIKL